MQDHDSLTINHNIKSAWEGSEIIKYVNALERIISYNGALHRAQVDPENGEVVLTAVPYDALNFLVHVDKQQIEPTRNKLWNGLVGRVDHMSCGSKNRPHVFHLVVVYSALGYGDELDRTITEKDILAIPGVVGCVLNDVVYHGQRYFYRDGQMFARDVQNERQYD